LGYYNLTEKWSLGAGTGLSFYEKMLIPLYGDVRFQIGRERKFTSYLEFAAGYSFAKTNKITSFTPSLKRFLNSSFCTRFSREQEKRT